ncbi:MAG: twin-arginine translocase TatA/TatE family subunit [Proteobacteria bacterium]|nr:twin-arginine translocase TatA/TatE family subunit [Pseudomonadota bacterium]
MFDVGFTELALIGLLALIIAGPERLPGIMRTLGRFAGRAKATFAAVRSELEREVDREVDGEEKPTPPRDEQDK